MSAWSIKLDAEGVADIMSGISEAQLATGLVESYWPMEDASGSVATDIAGDSDLAFSGSPKWLQNTSCGLADH